MNYVDAGAHFSVDRVWRYALWRTWDRDKPTCAFIGLNPSVADEVRLDPTVRRCIGYADRWGCGRLIMLNAFAFVSGDPKRMLRCDYPVSEPQYSGRNDQRILSTCLNIRSFGGVVVAAWSGLVTHRSRDLQLRKLLENIPLKVLGWTKDGYPRHPLYMRADVELTDFWR